MDSREKLQLAYNVLIKDFSDNIREIIVYKDRPVLKATFQNEIILYIRYNDYGEYTYCRSLRRVFSARMIKTFFSPRFLLKS